MVTFFRYARHADVPAFEATGWRVCAALPGGHGVWSVLLIWDLEGEPA